MSDRDLPETLNSRGEWVPSIPLPYFLGLGRVACDCGARFVGLTCQERYRGHYALVHVLGLS